MFTNNIYLISKKPGLALNNLQWLTCHKTKQTNKQNVTFNHVHIQYI